MKTKRFLSLVGLAALTLVGCGGTSEEKPTVAPATEAPASNTTATEAPATEAPASTDPVDRLDKTLSTEVVIGSPNAHQSFVKGKIESYLSAHGFTSVTVKMYELAEGESKDVADWTAAAAPDIYAYASDNIGALVGKGAMSPIPSTFVTGMTTDMGEEVANAGYLGDTMYGYPYAGDNGYFLYYNKDLVSADKIGSVDDIVSECKKNNVKFGYALDTESSFFSIGTFMTFGARYSVEVNEDGTLASATSTFGDDVGVKGGKAVKALLANADIDTTHAGARGKAPTVANGFGAVVEGSWNYKDFSEALGDKLGCAKLPTITVDNETKNLSSFLGYKLYGVNPQKSSENNNRLQLLHCIANYLVSAEVQEARFDALTVVPTNSAVKALDKVQASPLVAALGAQATYAVPQTVVPSNVWSGCSTAVDALKASDSDVATVMQTYAASIAASTSF